MKRPAFRWGHRARLSAIAGITAGILLAFAFVGIVLITRESDKATAKALLRAALRQAGSEVASNPGAPDLAEIASANPNLSLVATGGDGRGLGHVGTLPLGGVTGTGLIALPNGEPVFALSRHVEGTRITAALPWRKQESDLIRLSSLLGAIWLPLTGLAAFATWRASAATFRPLEELSREAEEMSRGPLNRRLHESGDDEFSQFAARLNRFLDRLEESVVKQEQFVQDAAHELRTPLAAIRTNIESTLRMERSRERLETALLEVLGEAERLSQLVEMLLRSAASDVGSIEPFDLATAAEQAHARWVDRFGRSGVTLELSAHSAQCAIDHVRIASVLDNLLANALRVSHPGSTCRIVSDGEGETARIEVEDEGPGIASEDLDRIFERFTRLDSDRSRDHGGFGIGLSVCHRLIHLAAGRIYATSSGKGCKFVIELPASTAKTNISVLL